MNLEDGLEFKETYELLESKKDDPDYMVVTELSFGNYVMIPQETFNNLVSELNSLRVKDIKPGEHVDLITTGVVDETE